MSGIINRPFCLQTGTNSSKKFQVQILGFELEAYYCQAPNITTELCRY